MNIAAMYAASLWVRGPARLQEIKRGVEELFRDESLDSVTTTALDGVHDVMRKRGMVISVRRGVYVLSNSGREFTKKHINHKRLDNRRLFLMNNERKRYLRARDGILS